MKIYKGHDGQTIEVNQSLRQFSTLEDLVDCFSLATGTIADSIICMTDQGQQLNEDVFQLLLDTAVTDESTAEAEFFIFNRDFLYAEPDTLAQEMAEPVVLEPHVDAFNVQHPPTPRSLEALIAWSNATTRTVHTHSAHAQQLFSHVQVIRRSMHIALLNLLLHASSIERGSDVFNGTAGKELARMQGLIEGHERDLQVLNMVPVHQALLPPPSSDGSKTGSAASKQPASERTLGSWINPTKMKAVADSCTSLYNELRDRVSQLEADVRKLNEQATMLQEDAEPGASQFATETLDEALQASARAEELATFVEQVCSPDDNGWPVADKIDNATFERIAAGAQELLLLDEVARECVRRLTAELNEARYRGLEVLNRISVLQSEYADFGAALAAVDADLHSNKVDGFKHLQRLKTMLWAYGATIIEVVRRREFADHFLDKSQALAELMSKLAGSDRERRAAFKSDVQGLLPFDVRGMGSAPPSLDIATSGTSRHELAVVLERKDIADVLALLDAVEKQLAETDSRAHERPGIVGALALARGKGKGKSSVVDVKKSLQKLIDELDAFEDEFERLVEKHLFSNAAAAINSDDDASDASAQQQLQRNGSVRKRGAIAARRELDKVRQEHEAAISAMQEAHATELQQLRAAKNEADEELMQERRQLSLKKAELDQAHAEVHNLKADSDTAEARRLNLVDEVTSLRRELEEHRRADVQARQQADEDAERIAELESHLADVQAELEDARAAQHDATSRIEGLLNKGSSAEQEIQRAQERISELNDQLAQARQDCHQAKEALHEEQASREKAIRTHRAEADGDRAILEEKLKVAESSLQDAQRAIESHAREVSLLQHEVEVKDENMAVLNGQLASADDTHEKMVQEAESARALAADAETQRAELQRLNDDLVAQARRWTEQMLHVRETVRGMPVLTSRAATLAESKLASTQTRLTDSEEIEKQQALELFQVNDAAHPSIEDLLKVLRLVSPKDIHDEAKTKLDSLVKLVKKWAKAYKLLKESYDKLGKLKDERIVFANFQVGDLALFLPTKQASGTRTWAAFNVGFPHYFMNISGDIAEKVQTKQWLVGKITKMVSHTVAADDEAGDPYKLGAGIKYYVLDVQEMTTPPPSSIRSRNSSEAISSAGDSTGRPPTTRSASTPAQFSDIIVATPNPDRSTQRQESVSDSPLMPQESPLDALDQVRSPMESPLALQSQPRSGLALALQAESRASSPALGKKAGKMPAFDGGEVNAAPAFDRARSAHAVAQLPSLDKATREALTMNPFSSSPPVSAIRGPVPGPSREPSTRERPALGPGFGTVRRRSSLLSAGAPRTSTSASTTPESKSAPTAAFSIPRGAKPLADLVAATGSSYGSQRSAGSVEAAPAVGSAPRPIHSAAAATIGKFMTVRAGSTGYGSLASAGDSRPSFAAQTIGRMTGRRQGSAASVNSKSNDVFKPSSYDSQASASELLRRFA